MFLSSIIISSCEGRLLFVPIHLTGVFCPVAQVLSLLSSFISLFNRKGARICSSLFLFASGVLSTSFISVVFFSQNGLIFSRFFGFTRLSKKQLSFTSSLSFPFSLRCHSRSRDEILSQWWSVVTPRDRCARCPPVIRCCCLVIRLRVASCHVIMCIASSCFQNLHPSGSPRSFRCPF